MRDMEFIIMAAGMGSRFGSLKQIEGVGPANEFVMDYAIYDAYRAGLRQICLVVRESFRGRIEDRMLSSWAQYPDLKFRFVCQELDDLPPGYQPPEGRTKPWGTAHVLYVLKKSVQSPFIIINADDFYGREGIDTMISFLKSHPDRNALVGYPLPKTLSAFGPVTRGVCDIKDGELVGIDEVPKIYHDDPRTALASMNLWGLTPSVLELVASSFESFLKPHLQDPKAEYQIPQVINDLVKAGRVKVTALSTDSDWFGVTYPEDKKLVQDRLNALIERGVYPSNLFKSG